MTPGRGRLAGGKGHDMARKMQGNDGVKGNREAVKAILAWMRTVGWEDAELTRKAPCPTIRSTEAVAQISFEMEPVPLLLVQAISGVASHEGRVPLCFAAGGFAPSARRWAARAGVALFCFGQEGQVKATGRLAGTVARRFPSTRPLLHGAL